MGRTPLKHTGRVLPQYSHSQLLVNEQKLSVVPWQAVRKLPRKPYSGKLKEGGRGCDARAGVGEPSQIQNSEISSYHSLYLIGKITRK